MAITKPKLTQEELWDLEDKYTALAGSASGVKSVRDRDEPSELVREEEDGGPRDNRKGDREMSSR